MPPDARTVLLCRYRGLNDPTGHVGSLARSVHVTRRPTIRALVHRLDTLKGFPRGKAIACPADDGSEVVAFFRYRRLPVDAVVVHMQGCGPVSNGRITRSALFSSGPALLRQLATLTR